MALRARKNGVTLAEIGRGLGVSRERARQIINKAERRKFDPPVVAAIFEGVAVHELGTAVRKQLNRKRRSQGNGSRQCCRRKA